MFSPATCVNTGILGWHWKEHRRCCDVFGGWPSAEESYKQNELLKAECVTYSGEG